MDDGKQKRPAAPVSYHFVTGTEPGQRSQIRHHAAKEWWRQRKAPGLAHFQRTRPRSLVPASTSSKADSKIAPNCSNNSNSQEVFINLRHPLQKRPREWMTTSIPSVSAQDPSPYQSLGYAELDPFNGIHLSLADQTLLHHCEFLLCKVSTPKLIFRDKFVCIQSIRGNLTTRHSSP